MRCFMCKLKPVIQKQQNRDMYEYISVFINNLEIVVKDTKILMDALGIMYKFKLEGTETTTFHVGCDLFHESNGVL